MSSCQPRLTKAADTLLALLKRDAATLERRLSQVNRLRGRVYRALEGWGWHFLASMRPIPSRNAPDMVSRMPTTAVIDLMEWGPAETPSQQFERMLSTEMTPGQMIALSPSTPALRDDRPINEYFLLRALLF